MVSLYGKVLIGLIVLGTIWLVTIQILLRRDVNEERQESEILPLECKRIALLYTWVNGSDPAHIKARTLRAGNTAFSHPSNNRFRDLGGLLYSLRSAEKYAPWIDDIYIVTSGQVPNFLDMKNPHIHIVPHSELFHNPSDLPTFSSNAIEASLHNLPDSVGDCFIYLNDDMFFASDVHPSDFWTPRKGQILFKSAWTAPPPSSRLGNIWHRSIHHTNLLLDEMWGHAPLRHYASHGPYFFSLKVLRHMYDALPREFNVTTAHPFRAEDDVSIPFLYNQFASHYYKSEVADKTINTYLKIIDDPKRMRTDFERVLSKRPKTVCMNDGLGNDPSKEVLYEMHSFFHKLFPTKSKFELHEDEYM